MSAPTLETSRLILRPWRDADIPHWIAMHADARVMEFFPSTYSEEYAKEVAERLRVQLERDGHGWWIAEIKDGGRFAGTIALQEVPFEAHFTPAREIGWRLTRDAWGHGYATEGARAVLDYAFGEMGCNEIVSMTAEINARSRRVMERLGMTRECADDFDHPRLQEGDRLRRHVLYRLLAR
ncbi:MAG TPA: GNAT family N-acetyltransferase [Candidatus Baltobacteraceae bacterium]|nr:GNAT family N-acetyltransferase [Candidatus Baltobacteraceae bacterium]